MVAIELAHGYGQRAALAGRAQPGVHLVKFAERSRRLAVLMIRCPSSLKKCWFEVLRADHGRHFRHDLEAAVWPSAS